MNRHCFRLILSVRLGMWVPVAEFHCQRRKPGQGPRAAATGGGGPASLMLTVLAAVMRALHGRRCLTALIGLGFASGLGAAEMLVDPNAPAQQQAGLSSTANGVPLVDIANPIYREED